MYIELSLKQFRRLLDMAYIGNWVLNSTRGDDRFTDYDEVESLLFGRAMKLGLTELASECEGEIIPSQKFEEGGIHEAIEDYEDTVFYSILAEELTRRDLGLTEINESNFEEFRQRMEEYISEFELHGIQNVNVDT